jgi:outer membrane protein assembly factor BamD (BamD/ComL family)
VWTPTVLVMDADGEERWRIEGYLSRDEFRAQLEMGLARIAFMHKQWAEAEERYARVLERYPQTAAAPEAMYWRSVSHYKRTNDHTVLGTVAAELSQNYQDSVWAQKASVWAH